jgi:cell division protein FtsW (lipid II flippase)
VQPRSSILAELGWLAYFFAVFVILVYIFNIFVVPHHFNDRIADVLAAGLAGVIMIGTRARWRR